jgi:hypothetical protein
VATAGLFVPLSKMKVMVSPLFKPADPPLSAAVKLKITGAAASSPHVPPTLAVALDTADELSSDRN